MTTLPSAFQKAIESNSDEIARLTRLLREAEAERDIASESLRAARAELEAAERHILILNQSRERLGNDVNAARADADTLAGFVAAVARAYMARGDWAALKEQASELLAAHAPEVRRDDDRHQRNC